MKELLQHILYGLIKKHADVFTEADNNSDKWYELFVVYNDGSTESVASGDTFAECFSHVGDYINNYRFDRMNIDVWYDRDDPKNGQGFFSPSVLYSLIREHLAKTGAVKKMAFYGSFQFNAIDNQCNFTSEHTVNGYIFKDEILFTYFCDLICYISEGEFEETNPENITGSTYNDILKITNGIHKYALNIFEDVDWQHPATLWEDWNNNGVLDDNTLFDDESKNMLDFLLSETGGMSNYQIVKDRKCLCKGLHESNGMFIAFDNTSGNCNVEEFELESDALMWLRGDYVEVEDFKGKTSLK